MDKLEEAMAWFDYSHEASMIPGDAWARSCDKHGKVLSVAIRLLQARLKESVVALGVSRVDRIAELEDALAVGLEQIKMWHKGAGTNPEHDSDYGRMAKIAGPGRTQEPQDKRIKDLEAKFAIEKRAADHWMQEANKDHNNLVRAESALSEAREALGIFAQPSSWKFRDSELFWMGDKDPEDLAKKALAAKPEEGK